MGNKLILPLLQEFGYSKTVELSCCDDLEDGDSYGYSKDPTTRSMTDPRI